MIFVHNIKFIKCYLIQRFNIKLVIFSYLKSTYPFPCYIYIFLCYNLHLQLQSWSKFFLLKKIKKDIWKWFLSVVASIITNSRCLSAASTRRDARSRFTLGSARAIASFGQSLAFRVGRAGEKMSLEKVPPQFFFFSSPFTRKRSGILLRHH